MEPSIGLPIGQAPPIFFEHRTEPVLEHIRIANPMQTLFLLLVNWLRQHGPTLCQYITSFRVGLIGSV